MSLAGTVAAVPVHLYRWFISPLLGVNCRYAPSCSEYALEALKVHGVARGSWLTAHRLVRCQPWGGSGYDPVPPCACGPTHRHVTNRE